jgi:hypothetical protein
LSTRFIVGRAWPQPIREDGAKLSPDRLRDRPHGTDPVPRTESTWPSRGLRREPASDQALKSLATHKTDRNDARGLTHLARTGFFKPVHVKSLPAHAIRSLIIARKKLVGQRVTLKNQIQGLAILFGVRFPARLPPLRPWCPTSSAIRGLPEPTRIGFWRGCGRSEAT